MKDQLFIPHPKAQYCRPIKITIFIGECQVLSNTRKAVEQLETHSFVSFLFLTTSNMTHKLDTPDIAQMVYWDYKQSSTCLPYVFHEWTKDTKDFSRMSKSSGQPSLWDSKMCNFKFKFLWFERPTVYLERCLPNIINSKVLNKLYLQEQ